MSFAGFSSFLPLLFISLCLSSAISPPSLFLAAGPSLGTTKGKIWFLDVFLLFFLSHLISDYRSLSTGGREMDQVRTGQGKQSGIGTTRATTAMQDGIREQARQESTSSVVFVFFLLTASTHSSSFWLPLFPQNVTIGRAGRDRT